MARRRVMTVSVAAVMAMKMMTSMIILRKNKIIIMPREVTWNLV